jgi:hypothetical protein
MSTERGLFSYEGWDGDAECMTFYNPVLKVQIGKYPIGTSFDSATIIQPTNIEDATYAILQLENRGEEFEDGYSENVVMGEYKLQFQVLEIEVKS